MRYLYLIEQAADGGYSAYVPDLPGCTTSGDSAADVKRNIKDAVDTYLDVLREDGQPLPEPSTAADIVEAA